MRDRERVDGPNFNSARSRSDQVLYAIRNGGFSGAIMPENIVVGQGRAGGRRVPRQVLRLVGQAGELAQPTPPRRLPAADRAAVLDLGRSAATPTLSGRARAPRRPSSRARVDELLAADAEWRAATTAAESLRAEQKQASEAIGAAKQRAARTPPTPSRG